MFIMMQDYYNGEEGHYAYSYTNEIVTERIGSKKYRIKTFSCIEEAREYATERYLDDTNGDGRVIKLDKNILAYEDEYGERTTYKWVDLNDPNAIIP